MNTHPPARRAVGIVRVSRVAGRDADHFISPSEQRGRIVEACRANGLQLVTVHEELDVSAGLPIGKRPGLSAAIAQVEAGHADTLVVAYFDRLVRNLRVQAEIVERIEVAGGSILAVDIGQVRADTASHWLSSTLLGAVAEYHRRMTAERTAEATVRSVAAGVPPYPNMSLGYRRGSDRRLQVDEAEAVIVRRAFELRADGGSWHDLRRHLAQHGIQRSSRSISGLIGSRVVLGELHFGKHVNRDAHTPIVDRALWDRAQRAGPKWGASVPGPKSDRLLARMRLLRCGSCGGSMVLGAQTKGGRIYPMYRCPTSSSCTRGVTISATAVEAVVVDRVRELLADESASATASVELAEARAELHEMRAKLDRAIDTLLGFDDVAAARQKLQSLRDDVEGAEDRVAELERVAGVGVTINAAADWDALTLDEQRALIGAVLRRVDVFPGRGLERITLVAAAGEPDRQ
jgi:site-specific DNA recombinase